MREHAKAVRDAGHQIRVVHLAGADEETGTVWRMEEEDDHALSEGIETFHVVHRSLPLRGASYPLYLWSAAAACGRLRANGFRPDVIHAHVYGAGVPAALIAARSRIPFVLTEHFSGTAQRSLSRVEARKARYAYAHAARVLPVSRFLQEAIADYCVDASFDVVPNAVDTSLFFPADAATRSDRAVHRLLFVGNLEPHEYKGFPTLLQSLARLQNRRKTWRLEVVGDGPERLRYEESARDLGLQGLLTFHGAKPKATVARMMREADLLVLPSRAETFGAAVAEALVSGVPVVATTVGGIPELVQDSNGRLVSPGDPTALADALDTTLERLDSFDRSAISAAARDRFGLEAVGARLSEIYGAVL